jgi:hypothetical protein
MPSQPRHEAWLKVQSKYPDLPLISTLLGRYDALAIGKTTAAKNEEVDIGSVARLKRLVRLGIRNPFTATPLAVVLISLHWDASRIMFGIWLQTRCRDMFDLGQEVFLSDGWEDAVVIVPLLSVNQLSYAEQFYKLTRLVQFLNQSPLVAGTETLFDAVTLQAGAAVSCRFVCGRSDDGLAVTKSLIQSALADLDVPRLWSIENVSGAKDIQVVIADNRLSPDIYNALHTAAKDGHFRVETRISWQEPPQPTERASEVIPLNM